MTTNANNVAFVNPSSFGTPSTTFKMSPMLVSNDQIYCFGSKNVDITVSAFPELV